MLKALVKNLLGMTQMDDLMDQGRRSASWVKVDAITAAPTRLRNCHLAPLDRIAVTSIGNRDRSERIARVSRFVPALRVPETSSPASVRAV